MIGNEYDLMERQQQQDLIEMSERVVKAIKTIQDGVCKRVDVNDRIKVYECKNIIRIDIKQEVQNG